MEREDKMPEQIIVRLELQRMRHAMLSAFTDYSLELNKMAKEAIESEISTERFREEFEKMVNEELAEATRRTVETLLWDGELRKIIREKALEELKKAIDSKYEKATL